MDRVSLLGNRVKRNVSPSLALGCLIGLLILLYLFSVISDPDEDGVKTGDGHLDILENTALSAQQDIITSDLITRIQDLKRIKLSLHNELKIISEERFRILKDTSTSEKKLDKIQTQIIKTKSELKQLEIDLIGNKKRKIDKVCENYRLKPIVFNPLKSEDIRQYSVPGIDNLSHASISDLQNHEQEQIYGFNLSKCSLTRQFSFSLNILPSINFNNYPYSHMIDLLRSHDHYNPNPASSCIDVTIGSTTDDLIAIDDYLINDQNNLVIYLNSSYLDNPMFKKLSKKAVIASPVFSPSIFRYKVDIVLPSTMIPSDDYEFIIESAPIMMPQARKYLASYFGSIDETKKHPTIMKLENVLQTIHLNSYNEAFLFMYNCGPETGQKCHDNRDKLIELSNFLIILPPVTNLIDSHTNDLIYISLAKGTIPVIFGKEKIVLPFDEVLDWRRASIILPVARLPELHFILSTFDTLDLYRLKYNGRRIYEKYLATTNQIVDTTLALISMERFNYPPPPIKHIKNPTYQLPNLKYSITDWTSVYPIENQDTSSTGVNSSTIGEILGPHEVPLKSASFRRNMSLVLNSAYEMWNDAMHSPFRMYPSLPSDPINPSEYKFLSGDLSFRPIASGAGGSGLEFSRDLGGDEPNEQFTVVLLTYERTEFLLKTLDRLRGMPYVNKYLVVWNSVHRPPDLLDIKWPTNLGAPMKILKVERNSLNNRFLPFDEIETDAILSLDDDSPLRQDEIIFAFRVWRESRDRIVGFPGRFHAWDREHDSWVYNSNHSCELSMVLTGGAFYHKFYTFIYTYDMPETIRNIVDKLMNCEDIAMNFLVAHLARKPPIKVTSRWTFTCTDCPQSLSDDQSHFRERDECLNIFASIYGYMPLLSTQHRSDSILFKTRLPADKQKCFKFV